MLAGLLHQHFNRPMMKDKETSTENETAMNAMADDNTETAGNTDIIDTTKAAKNVADTTINTAVDAASDANTTDAMTINADKDTHADVPTEDKEPDEEDKEEDQHEEEEKNANNNKKSVEVSRPQSICMTRTWSNRNRHGCTWKLDDERGELKYSFNSRLRIANYYHTNTYKPYLFFQVAKWSDNESDDSFSDDGKCSQTLQLQWTCNKL